MGLELTSEHASRKKPLMQFEADDSDSEDIEPSLRGRQRRPWSPRTRRALRTRLAPSLQMSRPWTWFLKAFAIFVSGFLFATMIHPFAYWSGEDDFDDAFRSFSSSFNISPLAPNYPTEYMKSVLPIPCHSHNDYWRRRPLFSALGTGCISIEADVWNVGNDLFVAHQQDEIILEHTLSSMYLNPIQQLLEYRNPRPEMYASPRGVFYREPKQTLVLVVDLKTPNAWSLLQEQLEPLREKGYLTFWNGADRIERPVTVVASGAAPFELLIANSTYRDIFYDAPLDALDACMEDECPYTGSSPYMYNPSNSYYASTSLGKAVGQLHSYSLTESQLSLIKQQIASARERGLVPRYWGIPRWPRGLRDEIWGLLLQANVGVINVDDLRALRKGQWGSWPQPGPRYSQ